MAVSLIAVIVLTVSVLRILQLQRKGGVLLAAPFLAVALLEIADLLAVSDLAPQINWKGCALFVEAVLPALWIVLSMTYARESGVREMAPVKKFLLALLPLLLLVPLLLQPNELFYAPDFPAERMLFLTDAGFYFYVAILAQLVAALVNFEVTLVNASPEALWRVKLDIVALGSMVAVLIFYYSNALLQRTLNMELVPLRSLLFTVASLMMAYSRTHWRGAARVRVSQRVLLRSAVLAAVTGYLLLLVALGEGMKYYEHQLPRLLTISFAFITGMLLLLLILSDRVKRRIKVFLHKNFYQSKYDYREQWLGLTRRLATFDSSDELLKRVLSAYCDIFGVRGGGSSSTRRGAGGSVPTPSGSFPGSSRSSPTTTCCWTTCGRGAGYSTAGTTTPRSWPRTVT